MTWQVGYMRAIVIALSLMAFGRSAPAATLTALINVSAEVLSVCVVQTAPPSVKCSHKDISVAIKHDAKRTVFVY
jgi:hypothetical protein